MKTEPIMMITPPYASIAADIREPPKSNTSVLNEHKQVLKMSGCFLLILSKYCHPYNKQHR